MSKYLVPAFFILLAVTSCQGRSDDMTTKDERLATVEQPTTSPTGTYVLNVVIPDESNPEEYGFEITNPEGQVLFQPSETFNIRHQTFFGWDDTADRVWVYSGDVGTSFWEPNGDGTDWSRFWWAENDVPAPSFLKEYNPERFDT